MKKFQKNFTVAVVCAGIFFSSTIYPAPVFADENEIITTREITPVEKKIIPEGNAYIPKGTKLIVEFTRDISSKNMTKGEPIPLVISENLILNGVVIIPAGTKVKGYVTVARKAGNMGRAGKLEITVESVKAVNGVDIPLQYIKSARGKDDVAGSAAVIAAVSIIGGFFMKGKNVNIGAGTPFEIEVAENTGLEVSLNNLEEEMSIMKPQGISITIE